MSVPGTAVAEGIAVEGDSFVAEGHIVIDAAAGGHIVVAAAGLDALLEAAKHDKSLASVPVGVSIQKLTTKS